MLCSFIKPCMINTRIQPWLIIRVLDLLSHCIVFSSLIDGFLLPLWYLQPLLSSILILISLTCLLYVDVTLFHRFHLYQAGKVNGHVYV